MYKIIFTEASEIVNEITGFCSMAEARSAVRDMDLMIPFTWEYQIVEAV